MQFCKSANLKFCKSVNLQIPKPLKMAYTQNGIAKSWIGSVWNAENLIGQFFIMFELKIEANSMW